MRPSWRLRTVVRQLVFTEDKVFLVPAINVIKPNSELEKILFVYDRFM